MNNMSVFVECVEENNRLIIMKIIDGITEDNAELEIQIKLELNYLLREMLLGNQLETKTKNTLQMDLSQIGNIWKIILNHFHLQNIYNFKN